MGEGEEPDKMITAEEALEKIIEQLDTVIETAEKDVTQEQATTSIKEIEVLPGFPEKVEGEIVFCDSDNINTDGICKFDPCLFILSWSPYPGLFPAIQRY